MKLSLIVTYRQRQNHLQTLLNWWQQNAHPEYELILVEVDATSSAWIANEIDAVDGHYLFLPCPHAFHKTKALNLGLSQAQGTFVAAFDVDLLPLGDTLIQHLDLAEQSPALLVSGYRLMCPTETIDVNNMAAVLPQTSIAPEDQPTALWKHLVQQERFGVVPLFNRDRLLAIGGWDETFLGWGGEDQDIIERYLQLGGALCRCPDLVYLHLFHQPQGSWTEDALVAQNRQHYYAKKQQATQPFLS